MIFRNISALLAALALSLVMFAGCGSDHACETDADCATGEMCHIEDGHENHCMEMGDDDDSAGDDDDAAGDDDDSAGDDDDSAGDDDDSAGDDDDSAAQ